MINGKYAVLVKAIKDLGSIASASRYLNLSPSALSHQLRKIEAELQVSLFERRGNRLRITEAGEVLYEFASKLDEQNKRVIDKIEALRLKAKNDYVHGYSDFESTRLNNQANSVSDFIHYDSIWPEGSSVLEVGCGVGAQTKILASQNPNCTFTSIDVSQISLARARKDPELSALPNVTFLQLDAFDVAKLKTTFDHVFVCFVLEHLKEPAKLLAVLKSSLRSGGTITVVEGDHGSTYFYPDSTFARKAVDAQIRHQRGNGGNANIGRELYRILVTGGYEQVKVSPRNIYVDDNNPALKTNFILHTFTAMIEGMAESIVDAGIEDEVTMKKGIQDLKRTNTKNGTFSYTFFKGVGVAGE